MITNSQIETALDYVIKLAMGINPLNGEDAKEDSVLNSPEIIRTMFTVKAVLEEKLYAPAEAKAEVSLTNGQAETEKLRQKKKKDTRKEGFPPEIPSKFKFQRNTTVTHFIRDMYACADGNDYKPVKASQILNWLVLEGLLEADYDKELDVNYKKVTEKGKAMGFSNRRVESGLGGRNYISVIFNETAQLFALNNMERILNGEASA